MLFIYCLYIVYILLTSGSAFGDSCLYIE